MQQAGVVAGSDAGTGEAPVFEEYVAARGRALWRTAWLLTGDAHKAEDLVQTALVKCWRRWDSIADDGAVDGYVRRALLTTYTDWWRRKWTGEVPTETLPEVVAAGTDLAVRQDVVVALGRLPRGQRAVVVLRFYEDLTEAQTAAALGITVGTVKSQTVSCAAQPPGIWTVVGGGVMSEERLKDLLQRAVPEAPEIRADGVAERAAVVRRRQVVAGGAALAVVAAAVLGGLALRDGGDAESQVAERHPDDADPGAPRRTTCRCARNAPRIPDGNKQVPDLGDVSPFAPART